MEEASSRGFITDILVMGALLASMWLTADDGKETDDASVGMPPEVRLIPGRGEPPR
ncbi:MAG: hypothetical protein VB144_01155 [Clostridia bacterium]|nr:hypothetical protein [Clostridia bacterium]